MLCGGALKRGGVACRVPAVIKIETAENCGGGENGEYVFVKKIIGSELADSSVILKNDETDAEGGERGELFLVVGDNKLRLGKRVKRPDAEGRAD